MQGDTKYLLTRENHDIAKANLLEWFLFQGHPGLFGVVDNHTSLTLLSSRDQLNRHIDIIKNTQISGLSQPKRGECKEFSSR